MIDFTVFGRAVPQGSKRAFVNPATGRAVMVEQAGARHKDWRALVRDKASLHAPPEPLEGPIFVSLHFAFERPKKHYHHRKAGRVLRTDSPPRYVNSRGVGDIDKLTRSILDAITDAGILRDDSQVSMLLATRAWTEGPGCCNVRIRPITQAEGEAAST